MDQDSSTDEREAPSSESVDAKAPSSESVDAMLSEIKSMIKKMDPKNNKRKHPPEELQTSPPIAKRLNRTATQKQKRATSAAKKRKVSTTKTRATTPGRAKRGDKTPGIPMGLSIRLHPHQKGTRKATCKKCQEEIDREDFALRHKYKKTKRMWADVDQYHMDIRCLVGMSKSAIQEFVKTDWEEPPEVKAVVSDLKYVMDMESSDSDSD